MSPEMRLRITAQNDTARGFAEVKRDAVAAANAVEASGTRASTAMVALGDSSRMAAFQQRNLAFQLNDVAVSLASGMNPLMVFAQQGSQIATIYGPDEGGVGRALQETGKMAMNLAKGPLAGVAVAAAGVATYFAAMTNEINKTAERSVSMGDVMQASFQLLGDSIMGELEPAFNWLGGIWNDITPSMVRGVNWLIGAFVGAYDGIKIYWSMLPSALGDISIQTANWVIDGIESMINGSIELLNGFVSDANALLEPLGMSLGEGFGKVEFGDIANPFKGSAEEQTTALKDAWSSAIGTDWVGEIGDRAQALAALGEEAEKVGTALKAANDNIDPLAARLGELSDVLTLTADPFEQMKLDLTDLRTLWEEGRISVEQYETAVGRTVLNTAASTLGMVGQLTGAFAQLFEGNKAFAVANAVVNTAEGITKALAQGGMFGWVGAAAVAASGAAQIATILSARPGTSSTPNATGGGGTGAAAAAPARTQGTAINLTVRGSGSIDVEDLVSQITRQIADGGHGEFVKVVRAA